jgi:hypothetical protein
MEEKVQEGLNKPLIHDFNKDTSLRSSFTPKVIASLIVVVIVGVIGGYLLAGRSGVSGNITTGSSNTSSEKSGTVVGSNDTKTFKDTAEGNLKEGGLDGEGAFHLERSGGVSQNVYLTSSTVDLSQYVGKKIKVWGQTQKAQHAGWLMDVGRIQIL